jgi:hypothetical protein
MPECKLEGEMCREYAYLGALGKCLFSCWCLLYFAVFVGMSGCSVCDFCFVGESLILSLVLVQARGVRVAVRYVQTAQLLLPLGQIRLVFADRGGKNSGIFYLMVMNVDRVSANMASAVVDELIIMVEALLWNSSVGFCIILVFLLNVYDRSNRKVCVSLLRLFATTLFH